MDKINVSHGHTSCHPVETPSSSVQHRQCLYSMHPCTCWGWVQEETSVPSPLLSSWLAVPQGWSHQLEHHHHHHHLLHHLGVTCTCIRALSRMRHSTCTVYLLYMYTVHMYMFSMYRYTHTVHVHVHVCTNLNDCIIIYFIYIVHYVESTCMCCIYIHVFMYMYISTGVYRNVHV